MNGLLNFASRSLPAGLFAFALAAGCSSSSPVPANIKNAIGSYTVTVSNGVSTDNDTLTVRQGSATFLLLNFNFGITTPDSGSDSTGLHATLDSAYNLTLASQSVYVDEAAGSAGGSISGTGKISGTNYNTIALTLAFVPGTVPVTPDDGGSSNADAGSTPPVQGTAATFTVNGTKE